MKILHLLPMDHLCGKLGYSMTDLQAVLCYQVIQGIHLHGSILFQRLLEQLLINKPDDPVTFLVDVLKRDNDDGM